MTNYFHTSKDDYFTGESKKRSVDKKQPFDVDEVLTTEQYKEKRMRSKVVTYDIKD